MRLTFRRILRNETARLAREEDGVAVVFTLCSFLFLFACCTSAWFVGENVRRKVELQNACDAAAYSAAVVQADGLSRMAVVNRAMSWSYVQMTKMQMDYITLRWLELTKERFEKDKRNTKETPLARMFSDRAGWHSLSKEWKSPWLAPARAILEKTGIHITIGVETVSFWFSLDCKDKTHNHEGADGGNGSYIGFRGLTASDDRLDSVRINWPTRDLEGEETYLTKGQIDSAVGELQAVYGEKGVLLKPFISAMKAAIVTYNALLPSINRQMASSIEKTAVRTLFENLPRDQEGNVDRRILENCRWTVLGGVSRPPREYASGLGGISGVSTQMCFAAKPYFSGLRNTEEDEMAFLNMADGLPPNMGTKAQPDVRLADYFSDASANSYRSASTVGLASGLDQWFIRCDPAESEISDKVSVKRDFSKVPGGIVRAYKNANYDEGASGASLVQRAFGNALKGIHRGNYITDLSDNLRTGMQGKVFKPLKKVFDFKPSSLINPGNKPSRRHIFKRVKWRAKVSLKKALRPLDDPMQKFCAPIKKTVGMASELANHLFDAGFGLDIEPSCNNDRMRFVDKCANVRDTTGLVSEYEWSSAYWFCNWGRLRAMGIVNFDVRWCMHPFIPVAALHGGRSDAKPDRVYHTGAEKGTDRYGGDWRNALGIFGKVCPWLVEEWRMFAKKGHSREDYRSSFVSLDGDLPQFCPPGHNTFQWVGYGGRRSNYLLKGFVRIYGDDRAVYDSCYEGVPSQPWVLNEEFFKGGGSIVVGVARKQSNFFADLFDDEDPNPEAKQLKQDILDRRSIFSAFTPADNRQHFVALSAARAAWAPRSGFGRADGEDSVNAVRDPPRRYEVRYDSVLDRRLGQNGRPSLPTDLPGLSESDRSLLEGTGRIGCVCGTPNTTARLRRQWNLSQTDWDGVLLPLRHAFAKHDLWDSGAGIAGRSGRSAEGDALSDWKFSFFGDRTDASATAASLLWDHAVWRKFSDEPGWFENGLLPLEDESAFHTKDVLPLPVGVDEKTPADLIRKRRIL